jgi:CheY-like chemotaxis protein
MLEKIYIIDDDAITLYLAQVIIEMAKPGAACMLFDNSGEALAQLQLDVANNSLPNVVLLDLNMPEMSGLDLVRHLMPLKTAFDVQRCHVYILTSSISSDDRKQSLACPLVRDVIHKPLSEERLVEIVKALSA